MTCPRCRTAEGEGDTPTPCDSCMTEIEFKLKTHERVKTDNCECSRHSKVIEMTGDQGESDGVKKIIESFDLDFARNPERWPKDSWRAQNR